MKYSKFILSCLIGGLTLAVSGCKDDDDAPRYQLQLGESGRINMQFDYQKVDTVVQLSVMNRDMKVNTVQLVPFTQTELDAYNNQWKTNYLLMPEDAYELATRTVTFSRGELQKSADITFYPSVLYSHLLTQLSSAYSYCLPIKMVNEATNDQVVYVANLDYPEMRLTGESQIDLALNAMTTDIQFSAGVFDNGVEIPNASAYTFGLVIPEDKEAWVAQYNALNGTQYELLPDAYVLLGNVSGEAAASNCTGTITIDRTPDNEAVLPEGEYILPVVPRKLNATDNLVLRYDTVAITIDNPLHIFTSSEKISQTERDTWRIVFCNSDNGPRENDGIITNILDGNQDTFWAAWYKWWDGQDNWWNDHDRGDDRCDYGLEFLATQEQSMPDIFTETGSSSKWRLAEDYIYIAGNRDYPTFVIDLGKEYYISEVGMCHRTGIQWAHTKTADVYVSNDPEFTLTTVRDGGTIENYSTVDENKWNHICTINTEKTTAEFWAPADIDDARTTGASKGRFLKFVSRDVFPEDNGNLQHGGVGEIWIKTVAAIDEVPVE